MLKPAIMISNGVKEKEVLINGLRTNYKIAGSGPAVLILHGWGSFSERWQKVQEILAENGYMVFVPDLAGFGKSDAPNNCWELNNYVNWLYNFSQKLGIEEFFLLGHSFGGRISIKFSLKYPQKIKKLILCASAGIKHKKNIGQIFLSICAKIANKFSFLPFYQILRKIFYQKILRRTDYLKTKGMMKETFKKVINEDLTAYLTAIRVGTLIIWGKNDKVTPLSDAYLMKKHIPESVLEIIPGENHDLNIKVPEKLAGIILKNLSG